MYFGKVRASGSNIRGFEGAAGGVIRWIRLVNDTAVAVDQLGMRQGAVAVYLDVWHRDLPEFLQLRTNNGDDRMKAHDVFPAVCYPDLFWKMAKENMNQDWYLMCPHEIFQTKGYHLEDFFGREWEERYLDCVQDPRISKRTVSVKDIIRLVLRSAAETGTPFTFNRDTVNRMNPNGHTGMIYCSNLCTEIAQNMQAIEEVSKEVQTLEGDTVVVTVTKPGEFVVCNLASSWASSCHGYRLYRRPCCNCRPCTGQCDRLELLSDSICETDQSKVSKHWTWRQRLPSYACQKWNYLGKRRSSALCRPRL